MPPRAASERPSDGCSDLESHIQWPLCHRETNIQPNPSCFGADEAAVIARDCGCQMVIAVGGGSTIDFGKGVAVLAQNSGTCWQYTERTDHNVLRPTSGLPVVAVPTTAGPC